MKRLTGLDGKMFDRKTATERMWDGRTKPMKRLGLRKKAMRNGK